MRPSSNQRLGLVSVPVLLSLALAIGACSSADSVADEATTPDTPVPIADDASPATDVGKSDGGRPPSAGGSDEDPDPDEAEPESDGTGIAIGLNHSIYCAEEAPFFDLDTNPIDTADEWPAEIIDFLLSVYVQDCEDWMVDPADPSDVDQIRSAVPTLILAGEYDHTTPIRQGEIAAAGLSDVELIEVPSTGHTTLVNDCARSIMVGFLRAPGGDRSCLADIAPLVWL